MDYYLQSQGDQEMDLQRSAPQRGRSSSKKVGGRSKSPAPKLKGTARTRRMDANKSEISPFRI
jgi:hypothetical protein